MGIFSRTRDIIAANVTDLLDKAEDPAKMIRMIILEIGVLDETLKGSEEDITKLQNKLREARVRQNTIVARLESANNRTRLREMTNGSKMQDAFSRFDVLERRVDFAEGRADAAGLGSAPKSLEEEIAELRSSEKVDAELEALKARLNKGA